MKRIVRATAIEKLEMREIIISLDEFNHAGREAIERTYHSLRKVRGAYQVICTSYDYDEDGDLVSFEYAGEFYRCSCGAIFDYFGEDYIDCYKCGKVN